MIAETTGVTYRHVYGYNDPTNIDEVAQDTAELYSFATKNRKRLYLFGGTHGIDPTGEPCGQDASEKQGNAGSISVNLGGKKVTGFAIEDVSLKRQTGLDFLYKNLARITPKGDLMSDANQRLTIQDIQRAHGTGDFVILLTWCFSRTWAKDNGVN